MAKSKERAARDLALAVMSSGGAIVDYDRSAISAARTILANDGARAMDEISWDPDKHALASAMLDDEDEDTLHEVIMLRVSGDYIEYVTFDGEMGDHLRSHFTPTGTRYELTEKIDHPRVLVSESDFKDAPTGTIAAKPGYAPWWKESHAAWSDTEDFVFSTNMPDHGPLIVFRWGPGETE